MVLLRFVRQLTIFIVTLLVASVLVFGIMAILPGDPARVALGLSATDADVTAFRDQFGLNRPLIVQYLDWIGGLLTLNLGDSYVTQIPIAPQIAARMPVTFILVAASMTVAVLVAIPIGTIMAIRHQRISGVVLSAITQLVVAIPAFLAGILLIAVFAVELGWLPAGGWTPPEDDFSMFLQQLILPALALGLVQGATIARYVRSAILDVHQQDYIRTARAKGLMPSSALNRHGLRNAAIPVVTVLALQLAYLLIGSVVVERVFVIPGLGSLLVDSVAVRDLIVVQDVIMLLVAAVLLINFLVDFLYTVIDPRLRGAS